MAAFQTVRRLFQPAVGAALNDACRKGGTQRLFVTHGCRESCASGNFSLDERCLYAHRATLITFFLQPFTQLLTSETRRLLLTSGDSATTICNSILADNFLWLYRRQFAKEVEAQMPMHRTRCIYY
ncbi:unnamed protein product [Schistocephalus solidus]|uniref:Queuosine salvage protein n=1 Tax=Schistocephalus solidus TaxID=70667 RepID=A0A183SXG1_SCHSO|nr:unnamed protein product [Schistocephalus solidus]